MKTCLAALVAAAMLTSPAIAKTKYEPLEFREPLILTGNGGSRMTKYEIDYWTSGAPPRRHQVLGLIRDNRGTGRIHGDAIGSKAVAKLVKEAGGDAVVIIDRNRRDTGVISGGQSSAYGSAQGTTWGNTTNVTGQAQAYGSGWSTVIGVETTVMVVIKYLPDEPQ